MSDKASEIIDEFDEYRAYVSHTLCKHRLFLGLSSAENARRRLRDASVWPLVRDEAAQLLELHSSLFGIISASLREIQIKVTKAIGSADASADLLLNGDDTAFEPFNNAVRKLSNLLSSIGQLLDKNIPDFSEEVVISYLGDRGSDTILAETYRHMNTEILRLIRVLFADTGESDSAYKCFWPASSHAYLLTRTAIVAIAIEDCKKDCITPIRHLQRRLRGIERVVSCWSPNARKDGRLDELQKALISEGFISQEAYIADLEKLGIAE